jgi:hypothetical protein
MSLGSESNLPLNFRIIDPLKIVVCSIFVVNNSPVSKRLPGDEYNGESPTPQ